MWAEIDSYDPAALATIRRSTRIASCESLYGRRQFRPYFEQQSVDVAIIDQQFSFYQSADFLPFSLTDKPVPPDRRPCPT